MSLRDNIQNDATKALSLNNGTGVIPMRVGKTLVGLNLASKYNRVLVGYPNEIIYNSWISDSLKFNISIDHITFTTYLSLKNYDLKEYDLVILDEIDTVSEDKWEYIRLSNPKKLNGLTGTPPKTGMKYEYYRMLCPTIYKVELDETTGIINKNYHIYVHLVEPNRKKDLPLSGGRFWSEFDKINFFENKYLASKSFKDMITVISCIANSKSKLDKLKELTKNVEGKYLVFVNTKKQCLELSDNYHFSGNKDNESMFEKFIKGDKNYLYSISQLKAGVTFTNVDTCFILHTYASASLAPQKISRTLTMLEESEKAIIHVICLNGTRDLEWTKKSLSYFNSDKITWLNSTS
jgi:superfamily II DNA or RNA helicase